MEHSNIDAGWTNYSNYDFYNRFPHKELDKFIVMSGLTSCTDMVLIQSHIDNATHILEVGAGLGRITKYLCDHTTNATIEAVEYSEELYKNLISLNLPAMIHHIDILKFRSKNKFDLIVLPWACFAEFSPNEQEELLKHLYSLCAPKATVCIDLIPADRAPENACASSGQFHSVKPDAAQPGLDAYLPTENQMSAMAEKCGFVHYHNVNYITETNFIRQMHIVHKRQ